MNPARPIMRGKSYRMYQDDNLEEKRKELQDEAEVHLEKERKELQDEAEVHLEKEGRITAL